MKKYYQTDRYNIKNIKKRKRSNYIYRIYDLIKKTKIKPKGNVLDVGCGDGEMSFQLKKIFPRATYFGTDISSKGCNLANSKGIKSKQADLNQIIPFKDKTFDIIIAQEIIEHLIDPDKFLEECNRVLKKDGVIIITTPNLLAWYQRILCLFGILPTFSELSTRDRRIGLGFLKNVITNNQPVGHIRIFNKIGLVEIVERYGFVNSKIVGAQIRYNFSNNILNSIYNIGDFAFSHFPSLASDLIIRARKK